jgi:hypothetical protein
VLGRDEGQPHRRHGSGKSRVLGLAERWCEIIVLAVGFLILSAACISQLYDFERTRADVATELGRMP